MQTKRCTAQGPVVLAPKVSAAPRDVPTPIAPLTPATVSPPELALALMPSLLLVAPKLVDPVSPVTLDVFVDTEFSDAVPGRGPIEVFWPESGAGFAPLPPSGAPAAPSSAPGRGGGPVSSFGARSPTGSQASRPTTNKACQVDAVRCVGQRFRCVGLACVGGIVVPRASSSPGVQHVPCQAMTNGRFGTIRPACDLASARIMRR